MGRGGGFSTERRQVAGGRNRDGTVREKGIYNEGTRQDCKRGKTGDGIIGRTSCGIGVVVGRGI